MLNIHSFQPAPLCGDCNLYVWLSTPSLGLPLVVVTFNFRYIKGGSKTRGWRLHCDEFGVLFYEGKWLL